MKGKGKLKFGEEEEEEEDFKFTVINHKYRATSWLKNLSLDDGQFCDSYDKEGKLNLFICGNIREN